MRFQAVFFATLGVLATRYAVFGLLSQSAYLFNGNQNTYFELFTPSSPDKPLVLNVNNASSITLYQNYDATLPMKVLVHGWWENMTRATILRQRLTQCGDTNVVIVLWTKGSDTRVAPLAETNVNEAGLALARFLQIVASTVGLDMNKVTIIGEGWGANIAGVAGNNIGNISTIVALDPSRGILSRSLSRDDAQYVQVIHTSLLYGQFRLPGDANFVLNRGYLQPGCSFLHPKCNHKYAANIFILSLCKSRFAGCRKDHPDDCGYVMGGQPLQVYSGTFKVITNKELMSEFL